MLFRKLKPKTKVSPLDPYLHQKGVKYKRWKKTGPWANTYFSAQHTEKFPNLKARALAETCYWWIDENKVVFASCPHCCFIQRVGPANKNHLGAPPFLRRGETHVNNSCDFCPKCSNHNWWVFEEFERITNGEV